MAPYNIRLVDQNEIEKIEILFNEVYERWQGLEYWNWMFDTPDGYIPIGAFYNDNLVAFYSAVMLGDHAVCYSAMVHPDYRGKKFIQYVAHTCYNEVKKKGGKYVYLFANDNIRDIYTKYLGFIEARHIIEYSIDYSKIIVNQYKEYYPLYFNEYVQWRYAKHPLHQDSNNRYILYYNQNTGDYMVFSTYKNRLQILDFTNLEHALGIGMFIAHILQKEKMTFWSDVAPIENKYLIKFIPTWKMYKKLDDNINLEKIMKNDRLRMCQSDVF